MLFEPVQAIEKDLSVGIEQARHLVAESDERGLHQLRVGDRIGERLRARLVVPDHEGESPHLSCATTCLTVAQTRLGGRLPHLSLGRRFLGGCRHDAGDGAGREEPDHTGG